VTRWGSRRNVHGMSFRAPQRGQVSVFCPAGTSEGSHGTLGLRGDRRAFEEGVMREVYRNGL